MTKSTFFIQPKETQYTRCNFDSGVFHVPAGFTGKTFIECHLENCAFVYEGEFFNLRDIMENCVVRTCIIMKKGEKTQRMVTFGRTEIQDLYITKLPMDKDKCGNADSLEFQGLLNRWSGAELGKSTAFAYQALITHLDAWGAQQREAGRQDEAVRILHLTHERDLARTHARDNHEINIQMMAAEMKAIERAEKAEAELAEARAEIEARKKSISFWIDRVNGLEAELAAAKPYDLKA